MANVARGGQPDGLAAELRAAMPPGHPADAVAREREGRLQAAIAALPPITIAPLVAWEHEPAVRALVTRGDLAAALPLFEEFGSWERDHLVGRLGEWVSRDDLAAFQEATPGHPLPLLAHAEALQRLAFSGRFRPDVQETSEFAEMTFSSYVGWSRELCAAAAALDPSDPTPWVVAQRAALAEGTEEAALAAAPPWRELEPLSWPGNLALVRELSLAATPEGPDEGLAEAARLHALAPEGHRLHALVAEALVLRLARGTLLEDEGLAAAVADLRREAGLLAAAHAASLGSPAWRPSWLDGELRNVFLVALFHADCDDLAWREAQALGGHLVTRPWEVVPGFPGQRYESARAWLLRHVGDPETWA